MHPIPELKAVVGREFRVVCPASGYPLDKITWSKGKNSLTQISTVIKLLLECFSQIYFSKILYNTYNIKTLKSSIYMYEQVGIKIMSIPGGIRTHDLWIRSPTRYPLRYGDLDAQSYSSVTCQLTANGCSLKILAYRMLCMLYTTCLYITKTGIINKNPN